MLRSISEVAILLLVYTAILYYSAVELRDASDCKEIGAAAMKGNIVNPATTWDITGRSRVEGSENLGQIYKKIFFKEVFG